MKMKKLAAALLALTVVACSMSPAAPIRTVRTVTASAADENEDDVIIVEGLKFKNNQTGYYSGYTLIGSVDEIKGDLVVPNTVNGEPLKNVQPEAFKGCTGITSVTFGSNMWMIGTSSFEGCTALKSVNIGADRAYAERGAFKDCTALEDIKFSGKSISLRPSAFEGCTALKTLNITSGLHDMEAGAFKGCTGIETVNWTGEWYEDTMKPAIPYKELDGSKWAEANPYVVDEKGILLYCNVDADKLVLPESVKTIGSHVFYGAQELKSFTIPAHVTKIGDSAFQTSGLTSAVIPETVTEMGRNAFYLCSDLTSVTLPDNIKYIPSGAFSSCTSLTDIKFPDNAELELSTWTFDDCTSLKSLTFGKIKEIGGNAFCGCTALEEVNFTENVPSIGGGAFTETPYGDKTPFIIKDGVLAACFAEGDIVVPDGVTEIGENAFYNMRITSVKLPDGIKKIGDNAFNACYNLKSINLPDSITEMGWAALRGCDELTEIKLPSGLKEISSSLCEGCTGITSITIPNGVTRIMRNAFKDCTNLAEISIPKGCTIIEQDAFKNTALRGDDPLLVINGNICDIGEIEGELVIPEGITGIENGAFRGQTKMTSLKLPKSINTIKSNAFEGCTGLESVEIAGTLTYDGWDNYGIFADCTSLKSVTFDKGTLTIPAEMFNGCTSLETVSLPKGLKKISRQAFAGCSSLSSIELPDGISMEESAFEDCTGLKSIEFPDNISSIGSSTFKNCTSLESVKLPSDLTSIGEDTFSGCTSLKSIVLPDNVSSIYDNAFSGCTKLEDVTLPLNVWLISSTAFSGTPYGEKKGAIISGDTLLTITNANGDVVIPDGVKKIGNYAFKRNTEITSVKIPEGVEVIGASAFEGCKALEKAELPSTLNTIRRYAFSGAAGLKSIEIPEGVTEINDGTFYGCSSMTDIKLNKGLKNIKNMSFNGCSSLKSLTLPDGLETIDHYVFNECENLADITIPDSVKSIGSSTFVGTAFLQNKKDASDGMVIIGTTLVDGKKCSGDIVIPEGVVTIDYQAFEKAPITSVKFPSTLKEIDARAFSQCNQLTSVEIPEGVEDIGGAFSNCTALTSVSLPAGVDFLNAFSKCTALTTVKLADGTKEISSGAFNGCTSLKQIDIPDSVEIIEDMAFGGWGEAEYGCALTSVKLPDSIKVVGEYAFGKCTELETVEMPEGFSGFGSNSFYGTKWQDSLTTIDGFKISNGVLIGSEMTEGDIVIPDGVKKIGDSVFEECSGIKSVTLPAGLEKIGNKAFYKSGVTSINIPDTVTEIGDSAFYSCKDLAAAELPESVERIGRRAFASCISLEKITFPSTLKDFGGNAFEDSKWLDEQRKTDPVVIVNGIVIDGRTATGDLVIPEGPDTIGESAFELAKVRTVVVPKSVKQILSLAFYGCSNMQKITILNTDCDIDKGAATITNGYSISTDYDGEIQIGDGSGGTTASTSDNDGGTGQSTETTAVSTTDDGGNKSTTAVSTTDDGGNKSTTAVTTTDDGGNKSTTAASTTDDGGGSTTTADTNDGKFVKIHASGTVADGFYFNHDTNKFSTDHADGITKLTGENAKGEMVDLTIDKSLYTFSDVVKGKDNPQDVYRAEQTNFTYSVNVFYDGVQVYGEDGEPLRFNAYIGVKGDANLDNKVDSIDATTVLIYYARMSTGADPKSTRFSPESSKIADSDPKLDELAAMLADVDKDVLDENNWCAAKESRKVDSTDGSFILVFYSTASTTSIEEFSAKDTWDRILHKKSNSTADV